MKKKQFEKLGEQIRDLLPGGVNLGDLIIVWPYQSIVRGLMWERSEDKDVFELDPFYLPLFAPDSVVLHLNFGFRLETPEGRTGWRITDPDLIPRLRWAVSTHAVPFLSRVATEAGVLRELRRERDRNAHLDETYAHALARAGEWEEARRVLASVRAIVARLDAPWDLEMVARCDALMHAMDQSASHARDLLSRWEAQARADMERELSTRKGYPPHEARP